MKANNLPTVLENIVDGRRGHLPEIKQRIAHVDPQTLPVSQRSLYESLGGGSAEGTGHNRFIMECKSSSPSLGLIRAEYNPGDIARIYSRYASGISVLCEPDYFGGDYDHLATVSASTHLPVLCKDFIVDVVQVHAARYFGADAILLMLSVVTDEEYQLLANEAARLGMDVLTEAITTEEVDRAIRLGAKILGINHRNLHDLSIDLTRSETLTRNIPSDVIVVSESGIRDAATVRTLAPHSHAYLVGSQLTGQSDIDRAARELVFGTNKVCGITSAAIAQSARAAGALYGGLIFEEGTPRNVSRETAKEIITAEPGLTWVGVSRRVSGWAQLLIDGLQVLQIHTPYQGSPEAEIELIQSVREEVGDNIQLWRAIDMTLDGASELATTLQDSGLVSRLVLDSGNGGTGTAFDWSTIPGDVLAMSLLAGGIGEDNLDAAIAVGTLGLDINSGAEYPASAGSRAKTKDAALLNRIFTRLRHASA